MGYSKDLFLQYRQEEVYRNDQRDKAERISFQMGTKTNSKKEPTKRNGTSNIQN